MYPFSGFFRLILVSNCCEEDIHELCDVLHKHDKTMQHVYLSSIAVHDKTIRSSKT